MKPLLGIAGIIVFTVSFVAYFYVRAKYKPRFDDELDDVYWEFEEQHPDYAKYQQYSNIAFVAACIGAIMLFTAMAI